MDGALSSDRHSTSGSSGGYQGGRGGGYRGRGGGRGGRGGYQGGRGGRRGHHPYRRDDYGGGRHNNSGGRDGGGGGYHGGGGRGGYHGGGGRGGRGRGGGGYRGGGRGGPRQPANRFSTETKSVDPQYAMMKQLTAMVAKMGDLGGAAEVAATTGIGGDDGERLLLRPVVRAIGTNVSDLVEVLCGPGNASLFLKFGADEPSNNDETNEESNGGDDDAMNNENNEADTTEASKKENKINASQQAGGLATLLLSCSSNLPLQTPSYAALTLGVDVKAPKETHGGFAKRCVDLGLRLLGRDLDLALECTTINNGDTASSNGTNGENGTNFLSEEEQVARLKSKEDERSHAEATGGSGNGSQIDAYYRTKLMLRYFAHLATIGTVSLEDGEGSLLSVLETLVESASRAAHAATSGEKEKSRALSRASQLLASLVLSTIPYILSVAGAGALTRLSEMVEALETNVVGAQYSSMYDPKSGPLSILLKGELDDVDPGGAMDEEEDDDDDDDEEEGSDAPAPCADTLQDLLRTVRKLIVSCDDTASSSPTRFALLDDAPWKTLTVDIASATEGGMDVEQNIEKVPMSHEGEALLLDLIGSEEELRCKSIPYLLSIENDNTDNETSVEIRCRSLDGIIFGRLAIFDLPPNPNDSDSDDDEEDTKEGNPNLQSYISTYSLIDRFFLSDAVRDVLICHRPMVSDAGAERNTAKEVAEQIWAVSYLFKPPAADAATTAADATEGDDVAPAASKSEAASKGIEYGIIETILSLLVQTTPTNSSAPSASPLHSHLYLSRVLLELTKLQPTLIPQALVLAVSGMFQDFLPSLTPTARENLGAWLGFHLVNTGGQWPKAYWDHWAPYAAVDGGPGSNSRGEFIKVTLCSMASMSSGGAVYVVEECLPPGSSLVQSVFLIGKDGDAKEEVSAAERDLIHRLWNTAEDPDDIRTYVISDELAESYNMEGKIENVDKSMHHPSVWWRSGLAIRALFHPVQREKLRVDRVTKKAFKEQQSNDVGDNEGDNEGVDNGMDDEEEIDETEDLLADMSDAISRFKPVILAALARDADAYDSIATGKVDDDDLLLAGEVSILEEMSKIVPYWDLSTMNSLLECLMKERILSGLAVARWALAEDQKGDGSGVRTHWWKFVSCAFRHVIRDACSRFEMSKTDLGGGIGMIVDDVGQQDNEDNTAKEEAAALRLEEVLNSTVPILKYVMERACQILAACGSEKKIPLDCADIVEGMKRLLCALLFHFNSLVLASPSPSGGGGDGSVSNNSILTASNIHKGFASMDADGEKLALMCQAALDSCKGEQGKRLLQSLMLSMEKVF